MGWRSGALFTSDSALWNFLFSKMLVNGMERTCLVRMVEAEKEETDFFCIFSFKIDFQWRWLRCHSSFSYTKVYKIRVAAGRMCTTRRRRELNRFDVALYHGYFK